MLLAALPEPSEADADVVGEPPVDCGFTPVTLASEEPTIDGTNTLVMVDRTADPDSDIVVRKVEVMG